jgi:predicted amidophosphoribosyltransferase
MRNTVEQVGMLIRNDNGSVAWAPWERLPAEAVCPKCGEPIRWCLDMFSFTTGMQDDHPFTLTHARCAWTREGFRREMERVAESADMPITPGLDG